MDMHGGGSVKYKGFNHIYIQAPFEVAEEVFEKLTGMSPHQETCDCCGSDFWFSGGDPSDNDTLAQMTAYDRNCHFDRERGYYVEQKKVYSFDPSYDAGPVIPLGEYISQDNVLVVWAEDVKRILAE
jgi:hypothetical protein